jgi:hypothetical protein
LGFYCLCCFRRIFRYPERASNSVPCKSKPRPRFATIFNAISGDGKNIGAITILLQPLKRFHEAAYAGFIFYFSGATYVLIANGNGIDKYGTTLFIILAVVVSYLSSLRLRQSQPQSKHSDRLDQLVP